MNKHTCLNNLHHGNFPKYVMYNSLLNIVFTKECVNYKAHEVLVYTLIFRVLIYYLIFFYIYCLQAWYVVSFCVMYLFVIYPWNLFDFFQPYYSKRFRSLNIWWGILTQEFYQNTALTNEISLPTSCLFSMTELKYSL